MNKLILGTIKGASHPVYIYVNKEGFFDLGCNGEAFNKGGVPVNSLDQDAFKSGVVKSLTDCDLDRIDDLICEANSLMEKIMIDKEPPVFAVSKTQHAMRITALKAVANMTWREIKKVTGNPKGLCRECDQKNCIWHTNGGKNETDRQ